MASILWWLSIPIKPAWVAWSEMRLQQMPEQNRHLYQ
jgi:hypothetical protein